MELMNYLSQSFVQNALIATALVSITCGLLGPFIVMRTMAFAVHGTSELAFTGAAGGLLVGGNPIVGAFVGALVVAGLIGTLGERVRERDSAIGVILAFGLGMGVLMLSFYRGFATQATNILFGNIFGVSAEQLAILLVVGTVAALGILVIYKPLLFASVDPEVAGAKGIPIKTLNVMFLIILALTVTAAAQVVGTLLVLSLAITPAATAVRLSAKPLTVASLSIAFALVAGIGGILLGLSFTNVKPSVFITCISFVIYLVVRLAVRR
jgi:zinc/manganese transport system permease protein